MITCPTPRSAPPRLALAVVIVIVAALAAPPGLGAQERPEEDVKTAVRAAWEAYLETFSAKRTDLLAHEVYAAPSYSLGAQGPSVRRTPADTQAAFDATHRALAPERYDRSVSDQVAVCVLNDRTALLTAHFTRYRTDDTVLMSGASSYIFAEFDDGWRIVTIMANPKGKLVACDMP